MQQAPYNNSTLELFINISCIQRKMFDFAIQEALHYFQVKYGIIRFSANNIRIRLVGLLLMRDYLQNTWCCSLTGIDQRVTESDCRFSYVMGISRKQTFVWGFVGTVMHNERIPSAYWEHRNVRKMYKRNTWKPGYEYSSYIYIRMEQKHICT